MYFQCPKNPTRKPCCPWTLPASRWRSVRGRRRCAAYTRSRASTRPTVVAASGSGFPDRSWSAATRLRLDSYSRPRSTLSAWSCTPKPETRRGSTGLPPAQRLEVIATAEYHQQWWPGHFFPEGQWLTRVSSLSKIYLKKDFPALIYFHRREHTNAAARYTKCLLMTLNSDELKPISPIL